MGRNRRLFPHHVLLLLIATPYFLRDPSLGPAISGVGAFAAAGLVAGVALRWLLGRPLDATAQWMTFVSWTCSCITLLFFVLPEWVCLPFRLVGDIEANTWYGLLSSVSSDLSRAFQLLQPLLIACCALLTCATLAVDEEPKTFDCFTVSSCSARWVPVIMGLSMCSIRYLSFRGPFSEFIENLVLVQLLLYTAPLVVCFAFMMFRGGSSGGDLLGMAVGTLIWTLFTRAVGTVWEGIPFVSYVLSVYALFGLAWAASSSNRHGESGEKAVKERCCPEGAASLTDTAGGAECGIASRYLITKDRLLRAGLAPRESHVAILTILGYSSAEASALLDIKATSVRATLYRVYRKLGVEGARDLRSLAIGWLEEAPAPPATTEKASGATDPVNERPARLVRRVARMVFSAGFSSTVVLLFAPVDLYRAPWGTGNALALGVVCAGVLTWFFRGMLAWRMPSLRSLRALIPYVLLVVSVAIAGFAHMQIEITVGLRDTGIQAFAFLSYALCTTVFASCGLPVVEVMKDPLCWIVSIVAPGAVIGSIQLLGDAYPACLVISSSLMFAGAVALKSMWEPENVKLLFHIGGDRVISVALAFSCIGMGAFFEQMWRSLTDYSVTSTVFPLLLSCAVGSLQIVRKDRKRAVCWAVSLALTAFSVMLTDRIPAMLISSMSLFTFMAVCEGIEKRFWPIGSLPIAAGSFAVGTFSALLSMNLSGDLLSRSPASFGAVDLPVFSATTIGFTVLFIAAGASWLYLCVAIGDAASLDERLIMERVWSGAEGERALSLLKSRGLSDIQAAVLMDVAHGRTTGEIAQARNYSTGAINSAKAAGYKMLGIHSRKGLIELISQVKSL